MPVYQHWDQLKTCMVGKSYPPEFYSWIENPKARNVMERIALETEEDYQSLIKILESFNVNIIRAEVGNSSDEYFDTATNRFASPPMTPRDYMGVFGDNILIDIPPDGLTLMDMFYNKIKDPSWAEKLPADEANIPTHILDEMKNIHNYDSEFVNNQHSQRDFRVARSVQTTLNNNGIFPRAIHGMNVVANSASICRVGKDLYYPNATQPNTERVSAVLGEEYRINLYNGEGHADSCFCPVVPGLIISLKDFQNYSETFPDWEVIELSGQSWGKVSPFSKLKKKNQGKWWIPGEEGNDALTEVVENWLDNWVGYVEETVFDVNMLVINEQNVIVNNYNKKVFDALERYGVTPHICNFRHRYFWDGGIHCITNDLDREGTMMDYFPERGEY
jgi:hypothetical protein